MTNCSKCGVCCKLFLINLSEEEYRSRKYKTMFRQFESENDFKQAEEDCTNILDKNEEDSCIYLKNNLCSIHESRPKSCIAFFCKSNSEQFKEMIKIIKTYKIK